MIVMTSGELINKKAKVKKARKINTGNVISAKAKTTITQKDKGVIIVDLSYKSQKEKSRDV